FVLNLLPKFEQFVGAEGFENGFAANVAFDGEEIVKTLVDGLNTAMAIEEEKTFGHAVEESLAFGYGAFVGKFLVVAQAMDFALLFVRFFFKRPITLDPSPLNKQRDGGS